LAQQGPADAPKWEGRNEILNFDAIEGYCGDSFVRAVGYNSEGKLCVFRGNDDCVELDLHGAVMELQELITLGEAGQMEFIDPSPEAKVKFYESLEPVFMAACPA
jgi:hypothetical protein